jgi:hypothetical protein
LSSDTGSDISADGVPSCVGQDTITSLSHLRPSLPNHPTTTTGQTCVGRDEMRPSATILFFSAGRRICLFAGMFASIIYTHGGRATSNYDITRTHSYSYPFFPEPSASHRHTAQREKNILITKLCSVLHNVRKILFITKLCSVLLRPRTQKTKNRKNPQ